MKEISLKVISCETTTFLHRRPFPNLHQQHRRRRSSHSRAIVWKAIGIYSSIEIGYK